MRQRRASRVWGYTFPSTTGKNWHFLFDVTLTQVTPQKVVVEYHSLTAGSGTLNVHDCGITWYSLIKANRLCHKVAYQHAMDWNELDAKIEKEKETGL